MELIVGVGLIAFVEGFVTAGAVPSIVGSATKSAAVRPLRVHEANCCLKKFGQIIKMLHLKILNNFKISKEWTFVETACLGLYVLCVLSQFQMLECQKMS